MSVMRRAAYMAGMMIRETGQALDRAGSRLQGRYAFKEQLSRHRQVMNLMVDKPIISSDVFLAPSASVIGNVELHASASVWYGAVVRADTGPIYIGERTSIADRAVVSSGSYIANEASVEPGAIVNAAQVGARSVIGSGAILSPGAVIGADSVVRPGSFIAEGVAIADGEVWAGVPAEKVGMLSDEQRAEIAMNVEQTVALASAHADECGKTHEQIEAEKLRQELLEERSQDYNSHLGLLGKEEEIVETQAKLIEAERDEQRKVGAA